MNDGAAPAPITPPAVQPDPAAAFQRLLDKNNNDGLKLASQLFDENFQLRSANRELKAQLPKDGTVQLSAEDAKAFQAFKDLGVEPAEIKESLDRIPELEKTAKDLSQMENYREVAAIHGYKVPVLKKLMEEHLDATFEFKTEKDPADKTKERKIAYITHNGDKALPFTEFAEKTFADFLPALKETADTPRIRNGNTPDPPPHSVTKDEKLQNEIKAQAATGRYTL